MFYSDRGVLNIKQQAAEHTSNLSPAAGSAPTQYPLPAPMRGDFQAPANNQPPAHLPTVPVRSSGVPASSTQPARPPIARFPQARTIAGLSSIWTPRFLVVFIVMFLVTVDGSLLAFNIPNPYGSSKPFPPGLDHAVEFGLSVVFIIVVLIASTFVRNTIAKAILYVSALSMVFSAFAFLVQMVRDIQQPSIPPGQLFVQVPTLFLQGIDAAQLGLFLTAGLIVAAIVSFVWLTRPYQLPDRIVLGVAFGIAAICAILQSVATSGDLDVGHHIYLLVALIALILGVLIAVQTERVRMATK